MKRASIKQLPPADFLRRMLDYNPETGVLVWRRQDGSDRSTFGFNNKCGDKPAGTIPKRARAPYLVVLMTHEGMKRAYLAHRIIWKLMTGDDPPYFIDHADGDRLNNVWRNLRLASHGQNTANSVPRSRSGFKGVYWCLHHKKWRAVVTHDKRQKVIGHYPTPEMAAEARHLEATRLQGQFARTY